MAGRELRAGYDPAQDEVLKILGLSLIASQGVERLLSLCMTFVLRDQPLETVDEMNGLVAKHSRATLGTLLKLLRSRVVLEPAFDARFEQYLDSRNIIAHRLHDVPGGLDLHSHRGREVLAQYLTQFLRDAEYLSMTFMGLLRAWSAEMGFDLPDDHVTDGMLAKLDTEVIPRLGDLFRTRPD